MGTKFESRGLYIHSGLSRGNGKTIDQFDFCLLINCLICAWATWWGTNYRKWIELRQKHCCYSLWKNPVRVSVPVQWAQDHPTFQSNYNQKQFSRCNLYYFGAQISTFHAIKCSKKLVFCFTKIFPKSSNQLWLSDWIWLILALWSFSEKNIKNFFRAQNVKFLGR